MSEQSITRNETRRMMTNAEMIQLASHLFRQANVANIYLAVARQYMRNVKEYTEEMQCSCTFYSIIYKSLAESIFMCLSRLYDTDAKSLTLRKLLNNLERITVDDLHPELQIFYRSQEKMIYKLKPVEEKHFPKEVQERKEFFAALGKPYQYTTVNLSLQERIHLFRMRLKALKNPIDNLQEQRNKVLAHNDSATYYNQKQLILDHPIENVEVHALIEFALDLSRFVYEMMTNETKDVDIANVDDWETTLRLVRVGLGQMTKPVIVPCKDDSINESEE